MKNLLLWVWLCILVCLSFSSKAVDCSTTTVGLCDPVVEEIILDEVITEEIEFQSDGILTTTTTETTIQTTTVTNENSGDILDSDNGFVVKSKDGSMAIADWGGQGPASMPTGDACGQLNVTKCAMITGSGNSTSTMGVEGMGTTFIQTVNISDLNIKHGGQANYEIRVDKQDAQDSIYMHITGKDGQTNVFSGTDILSASGTASGYQTYENSFDFGGSLTSIIIEVGGRDINLAVGPLFDDVSINILYNTISTIISQQITSVEMFVALNIDAPEEIINVVEDIFETNEPIQTDNGITFEPITIDEPTYESVEIEIQEIEIAEIEVEVAEIEMEIEAELEMPEAVEETPDIEEVQDEPVEETSNDTDNDTQEETENKESISEAEENEEKPSDMEEKENKDQDNKVETKEQKKEEAAKKIVKKMGDKGKYDSANQTKTLIVMQVLGNSKTFFDSQKQLQDTVGFFTDKTLPDAIINDNDLASYFLFVGSDGLMNEMIESQWQN